MCLVQGGLGMYTCIPYFQNYLLGGGATEDIFHPTSPGFEVTLISRCLGDKFHRYIDSLPLDPQLIRACLLAESGDDERSA